MQSTRSNDDLEYLRKAFASAIGSRFKSSMVSEELIQQLSFIENDEDFDFFW